MEERGFTFFMENSAGERATFDIEFCESETSAIERARRLLQDRPQYRAVEVFDGAKSIRVERPSA